MEFLPLSRRRSSAQNVLSNEERGETDVFAGYLLLRSGKTRVISYKLFSFKGIFLISLHFLVVLICFHLSIVVDFVYEDSMYFFLPVLQT